MASRRLPTILAFLVVATSAGRARAEPTAAEKETARSLMDEGHAREERGDHKGALESFAAADALMHVPTTGLEVARQQVALGLLVEARDTLQHMRRLPVAPDEPAPFTDARARAQAIDDDLAARIPSLRLSVTGCADLATARIEIDRSQVPVAVIGVPFRVNPGHHMVTLAATNGDHAAQEVEVAEGATKQVDLAVAPPVADAREGARRELLATPSESDAPPASPARGWLRWGGAGLAAAGLGVGAVTGIVSLSSTSSARALCQGGKCPPSSWSDLDTAHATATASDISFVVAGVGVAAIVTSFFLTTSSPASPPATARIVPWFGPTCLGASGTF